MRKPILLLLIIFSAFILHTGHGQDRQGRNNKRMAITIDDLPVNSQVQTLENKLQITLGILDALQRHEAHAVGFVNEGKLYKDGILVEDDVKLLERWVDYGMGLGNHGYNHSDINRVSLEDYTDEIKFGEIVTKDMMTDRGLDYKYYRHPFLHTGNTPDKKEGLQLFLNENNYVVAPVTIDNSEWIYARAYENAVLEKNAEKSQEVGNSYVEYMIEKTKYYQQQSMALFGYQIDHVLLIHANRLNADFLGRLLEAYKKEGYAFITLDEALKDQAYGSPDQYVGNGGISWLHRWAISLGKTGSFFRGEPKTPQFVQDIAGITE